ncbi:MAG TPA: DoxX family protein [Steroidobacteraceae bacterium]|nr:DoxX family protein [Steroidobacteraceae bacterium]
MAVVSTGARARTGVIQTFRSWMQWLGSAAGFIAPPLARIALAVPFFRSGITKWSGFLTLAPTTDFLFEEQFKLHWFGNTYDFPAPDLLAYLDSVAEIVLPVLLVIGLGTRLSALGLLFMTVVIQLTVPSGWANFHILWGALAFAIMAMGPGPLSLDHLIQRWVQRRFT